MNQKQNLARLILNLSNTIIHNRNRHLKVLGLTASQADAEGRYQHGIKVDDCTTRGRGRKRSAI